MADNHSDDKSAASAGGASDQSSDAASKAGSDPSKTATGVVEADAADKSGASDDANGAGDGGDRQRPGREERRFSELTNKIKDLETKLTEQNKIADSLKGSPVSPASIKFPDYSQMSEVTPEQLKADIIATAEQIVDLKMTAAGTALERQMTQGQAVEKSLAAIEATVQKYPALNPDSDDYDKALDQEITDAYADVLQRDPSYSFSKFIKPFERVLTAPDTTSSGSEPSSRGRSANRPTVPSRSANAFPEGGTSEQMEAWFAKNRR